MIYQTSNTPQGGSKYGAPWEGVIQELKISRRPSRAASYCQEEANARWWQCIKSPNWLIFVVDVFISLFVPDQVEAELLKVCKTTRVTNIVDFVHLMDPKNHKKEQK